MERICKLVDALPLMIGHRVLQNLPHRAESNLVELREIIGSPVFEPVLPDLVPCSILGTRGTHSVSACFIHNPDVEVEAELLPNKESPDHGIGLLVLAEMQVHVVE
jgi:hypothetical protein